ncbi:MAG: hypothetical protein IKJ59_15935 [Clostridia bacterium]|nr:hypothetical protein [Clostridia bacterium]
MYSKAAPEAAVRLGYGKSSIRTYLTPMNRKAFLTFCFRNSAIRFIYCCFRDWY